MWKAKLWGQDVAVKQLKVDKEEHDKSDQEDFEYEIEVLSVVSIVS